MLLQVPEALNSGELETLRAELSGATFADGAKTAGATARGVKHNLQLPTNSAATRKCAPLVLAALRRNKLFLSAALPHRIHGPLFSRYDPGMTYGDHVDNALMGTQVSVRTDLAATLFLTPPDSYEGGELSIHDSFGVHRVKLPAGSMVVYPASSTHRVEPIKHGSRIAAVLWIQSLVRDEAHRQVLLELDLALAALREKASGASEVAVLTSIYHKLLRLWAEN